MKPRLAEILGVEVNEEFFIKGESYKFRINDRGQREMLSGGWRDTASEAMLQRIINNPSLVIRTKQFSDDEKAFMRLLVDAGYKWLARVGGCLYIYKKRLNEQDDNWFIDFGFQYIPQELFPQIMQGDEPINMNEVI